MKKQIIFCLVILATLNLKAQRITENSTAEECVQFIDATAKTMLGKGDNNFILSEARFTGNDIQIVEKWKYFDLYYTCHIPDWQDFKQMIVSESDKGKIEVGFHFKNSNLQTEDYFHYKTEGQIETGLIDNFSKIITYSFMFYIPEHERDRIRDLETAAKRLQKLAIEKSGKLFTGKSLMRNRKIKEIEGKPTYDETVKFIMTFLEDNNKKSFFCNGAHYKNREAFIGEDYTRNNVILKSKFRWDYYSALNRIEEKEDKEFSIDLTKVEKIDVVSGVGFSGGCLQVGLWFIEKGKSATAQMHLPLWNVNYDGYDPNQIKKTEIYKAFEHLRKLCGAPEPLSFD